LFNSSLKAKQVDDALVQEPSLEDQQSIDALHRLLEFLQSRYGSLETAFSAIDVSGNGSISVHEITMACTSMGYRNDVKCLMRVLDKGADGSINRPEWMRLKPYMNRTTSPPSSRRGSQTDDESVSAAAAAAAGGAAAGAPPSDSGEPLPSMSQRHSSSRQELSRLQAQATAVLLIFRNGDQGHAGEPILVRRWPPSSLADLVKVCGENCPPLIGPSTRLLHVDLRAVRSVSEVVPGGAYLLKGQEAVDPPPLFFEHRLTSERSLRQLARAKAAAVVERDDGTPGLPRECSVASAPFGSPPWLSQSQSAMEPPRHRNNKWQVDGQLGMLLSNGGLGQAPQHHHFHTWSRALSSSDRGIDKRSMSATF